MMIVLQRFWVRHGLSCVNGPVWPVGAGCYSQAALPMPLSKPLYMHISFNFFILPWIMYETMKDLERYASTEETRCFFWTHLKRGDIERVQTRAKYAGVLRKRHLHSLGWPLFLPLSQVNTDDYLDTLDRANCFEFLRRNDQVQSALSDHMIQGLKVCIHGYNECMNEVMQKRSHDWKWN